MLEQHMAAGLLQVGRRELRRLPSAVGRHRTRACMEMRESVDMQSRGHGERSEHLEAVVWFAADSFLMRRWS